MPVHTLDSLPIMGELDTLRDMAEQYWDELDDEQTSAQFLSRTRELNVVAARIGELEPTDPRLGDIRDLSHARCIAACAQGNGDDLGEAAGLLATLALSAGDPHRLATARLYLAEGALLRGDREAAEQYALSVRFAEKNLGVSRSLAGPVLERIRSAQVVAEQAEQAEPEQAVAEQVQEDQPTHPIPQAQGNQENQQTRQDGTTPGPDDSAVPVGDPADMGEDRWQHLLSELRNTSGEAALRPLWEDAVGTVDRKLAQVTSREDVIDAGVLLRELWDVVTREPRIVEGRAEPGQISRAAEVHRMLVQVFTALDDAATVAVERERMFQQVLGPSPDELPVELPAALRAFLYRLRLDLPQDITGDSRQERLFVAQQLVASLRAAGDLPQIAEGLLTLGDIRRDNEDLRSMYDSYNEALSVARSCGDWSVIAWATVRLSYAQFSTGNNSVAMDMLLSVNDEINAVSVDSGDPDVAEAFAEVKFSLTELYKVAGPQYLPKTRQFMGEAAELFMVAGRHDRAEACRREAS